MNKKYLIKIIILAGTLLFFANNDSLLSKNISPEMAKQGIRALQELGLANEIIAAWKKGKDPIERMQPVYNISKEQAKEKLIEISTNLKKQIINLGQVPINIQKIINKIKKLDISTGKNMKEFGKLFLKLINESETTKGLMKKLMEQGPPLLLFLQGNMFVAHLQ